jgi:hypothetical protein
MKNMVWAAAMGLLLAGGCTVHNDEADECRGAVDGDACGEPTPLGELSGRCHAGGCCTGCWDGHQCHSGAENASCGLAGDACVQCGQGYACTPQEVAADQAMVTAARLCQPANRTVCQTTDGVMRCWDCGEVGQRCCDSDACVQGATCIVDIFNVHVCVATTSGG